MAAPDGDLRVIATHVQPDAEGPDPTLRHTQDIARLVQDAKGDGVPVVMGGDVNFEPGSSSWEAITAAGVDDTLAAARPLGTWSSDDPTQQIDHIFVSDGAGVSDPLTRHTLGSPTGPRRPHPEVTSSRPADCSPNSTSNTRGIVTTLAEGTMIRR